MHKDNQLCSLELAKKLKKLGIKQHSLFYWEWLSDTAYQTQYIPFCVCPFDSEPYQHFSAFTASELFDLLPHTIKTQEPEPFNDYRLYITKSFIVEENISNLFSTAIVNYTPTTFKMGSFDETLSKNLTKNIWDKNICNALAKMLIFLIENKLMEV